jgi:hypothetical protein
MYSVIKNVFGSFDIHVSGTNKDEAIAECANVIGDSHGGEAYVVSDKTAQEMNHESCTDHYPFEAFAKNGKPYTA